MHRKPLSWRQKCRTCHASRMERETGPTRRFLCSDSHGILTPPALSDNHKACAGFAPRRTVVATVNRPFGPTLIFGGPNRALLAAKMGIRSRPLTAHGCSLRGQEAGQTTEQQSRSCLPMPGFNRSTQSSSQNPTRLSAGRRQFPARRRSAERRASQFSTYQGEPSA
jgi:hypothetical protein